jgi:hypothetical protein
LPVTYIASLMTVILLFEFLPYIEEFVRGLRANHGELIPPKARHAQRERHRFNAGNENDGV